MLALAMEGEGLPIIDIVGDAPKGPLLEASMASSSSDASSSGAASEVAEIKVEASVDPNKLAWSFFSHSGLHRSDGVPGLFRQRFST
jgi:hypothetical protein